MTVPNVAQKHDAKSLTSASDIVLQRQEDGNYPEEMSLSGVILIYQKRIFAGIKEAFDGEMSAFSGQNFRLYLLDEADVGVAYVNLGAPITCSAIDILTEYDIDAFVTLEYSGCLQPSVEQGDIMICDKAIRDEGASYHYLPDSKYAHASSELVSDLEETAEKTDFDYHTGASWTVEVLFRETAPEVKQYSEEGVLSVEMEAATLFAVAEANDAEAAAMFLPSDYLHPEEWEREVEIDDENMFHLFTIALDTLSER